MSLEQSGRIATAAQRVGPLCACLWLPLCSVCAGTGLGAQEPSLARAHAPQSSQPHGEAGAGQQQGKARSLNKESIALPRRALSRAVAPPSPSHSTDSSRSSSGGLEKRFCHAFGGRPAEGNKEQGRRGKHGAPGGQRRIGLESGSAVLPRCWSPLAPRPKEEAPLPTGTDMADEATTMKMHGKVRRLPASQDRTKYASTKYAEPTERTPSLLLLLTHSRQQQKPPLR